MYKYAKFLCRQSIIFWEVLFFIDKTYCSECHAFVRTLAALRAERAPPAVRATASAAWQRRWWGQLSCAVQRAVASTLVGGFWVAPPQPRDVELPLADVLDLADPPLPSRLPLISH